MLKQTILFLAPVNVCSMCWTYKIKELLFCRFAMHLKPPLNMDHILSGGVIN